jgi:hypothetical protein
MQKLQNVGRLSVNQAGTADWIVCASYIDGGKQLDVADDTRVEPPALSPPREQRRYGQYRVANRQHYLHGAEQNTESSVPAVVVAQGALRLELASYVDVAEHAARYDLNQKADDKNNEESKMHVEKRGGGAAALGRGKTHQLYARGVALSASPADPADPACCERLDVAPAGGLHERDVTTVMVLQDAAAQHGLLFERRQDTDHHCRIQAYTPTCTTLVEAASPRANASARVRILTYLGNTNPTTTVQMQMDEATPDPS